MRGVVEALLEREDINPEYAGIRYGETPLLLATRRSDNDNENQTPLSLAFSKRPDGIAGIQRGRDNPNSDQVNHGGQESLPLPSGCRDEFVVEMQFKSWILMLTSQAFIVNMRLTCCSRRAAEFIRPPGFYFQVPRSRPFNLIVVVIPTSFHLAPKASEEN